MKDNEVLYHYTDASGLIGIFTSKTIWATSLRYLNDSREDLHGANLIGKFLQQCARGENSKKQEFLKKYEQKFSRNPGGSFIYASSFSERPDVLSQWRGYAPAGGYAIGFRKQFVERLANINGFLLRKCEYDTDRQMQIIEESIQSFVDEHPVCDFSDAVYVEQVQKLRSLSETIRPYLKNDSFQEENEWRIFGHINALDPRCKWRSNGPYIVPYAVLDFSNVNIEVGSPIAEIWIGPGMDADRASAGITHILIGQGYSGFDIQRSRSPYRF